MKVYDYSNIKNCLVCGSINNELDDFIIKVIGSLKDLKNYTPQIHPKELERMLERTSNEDRPNAPNEDRPNAPNEDGLNANIFRKPRKRFHSNLNQSVVIVNGANSFGFNDLKYYYDKFEMLNKILADNNTHILFVRGNDDPKYFEDELINLSNIKTIQDYSVIRFKNFNFLCIGGCISVDRFWKIKQEKRTNKKIYWENENLEYKSDDIDKIIKNYNISCLVTASSPSFTYPSMNSINHSIWSSQDKEIVNDTKKERLNLDKIYNQMVEYNRKPYVWVYSKFDNCSASSINDILFKSLSYFEMFDFNTYVSEVLNVDISKAIGENELCSTPLTENIANPHCTFDGVWDVRAIEPDLEVDAALLNDFIYEPVIREGRVG